MTWAIFLNNQTVKATFLLPNGNYGSATRYIFIDGRDLPIIFTDEESTVSQSWAVGVDDGKNPHYQLGYEGGGEIRITVEMNEQLQYNSTSGSTTYTNMTL